jgi:hypothetical protein
MQITNTINLPTPKHSSRVSPINNSKQIRKREYLNIPYNLLDFATLSGKFGAGGRGKKDWETKRCHFKKGIDKIFKKILKI